MTDVTTRDFGLDSTRGGPTQCSAAGTSRAGATGNAESELASLLRSAPELARNRSFIIERAVDEFSRLAATQPTLTPTSFSRQFEEFGSSVPSSICRQLEVDRFVDRYSWLRDRIGLVEWPAANERLGSFRVIEEIGRGASSRVYLCSQPDLGDRQVVVKIGGGALLEAHALGRLQHAHIVPIYAAELDSSGHRVLICMPFLGRSTLHDLIDLIRDEGRPASGQVLLRAARAWDQPSDRIAESALRRGGLPRRSFYDGVAYIGSCLAGALAHAHAQGIVHGDVKPSNILLAQNGEPSLMDFDLSGNASLAISARGGTLPYMPPEQLRTVALQNQHAAQYEHRSDVFSLGVVLYELLSGQSPFPAAAASSDPAETAGELLDLQRQGCIPLRKLNRKVPNSLAKTVEQCLAFRPEDRVSSALELQWRLRAELRPWRRLRRQATLHPWTAAASAGCLMICMAAVSAHLAAAPPEHVKLYQEALRLRAAGDPRRADALLARTVAIEPSFRDARFEYGKAMLARGETGLARESFLALTESANDGPSAAYLAYCFCLEHEFSAAILWYERALDLGYNRPDLHNNLAVAYQTGRSPLDEATQVQRADLHIKEALRRAPASPTIRLNYIIHVVRKARHQGSELDAHVLRLCEEMTAKFPTCAELHEYAARAAAYSQDPSYLEQGVHWLQRAQSLGAGPPSDELRKLDDWKPFRKTPLFAAIIAAAEHPTRGAPKEATIPLLWAPKP